VQPAKAADWWNAPYRLPGGAIVTALSRREDGDEGSGRTNVHDGNVLLDRATGQYVALSADYSRLFGAPTGDHAVAANSDGGIEVVDVDGGRKAWQQISVEPDWSADGSRFLFNTDTGYGVMDVTTGEITRHDTPAAIALCPDVCRFSWMPGEREVAIAQIDPAAEHSESRPDQIKNIAIYDAASARRLRTVPVAGLPIRQDAWSPDGTRVILDGRPGEPHAVADVTTGRLLTWLPIDNAQFLPNGQILAVSNLEAVLFDTSGKSLAVQGLPYDFRNREISIGRP
jgi:dipeptidyl aminopeptidase/acylaminoacyl peptidase